MHRQNSIIILIFFLIAGILKSQETQPKNLDECNLYFDKTLSIEDIDYIRKLKEVELSDLHFKLGLNIRNNWLWGNRNPPLLKYFNKFGLFHPDDISGVILQNYWCYLNNIKFNLKAQVKKYKLFWENTKKHEIQNNKNIMNTESKFKENYIDLQFINDNEVPKLKIPDKMTSFDIFSNEFIKFKSGYIINSLTTAPGDTGSVDVRYDYFYFDLTSKKLFKLKIDGFDYVESIISIDSTLYLTGKFNKKNKIVKFENEKIEIINLLNQDSLKEFSDKSWIKFGKFKNNLFALQNNGLYIYNGIYWQLLTQLNLEDYFKSVPTIPTENIKINNNKIYFLQEVLQMRDCYLVEIDLKKNSLFEFWTKHKIIDDDKKEISSYTIMGSDSVFVSANIGTESLVLIDKNIFKTLIYNDKIKSDSKGKNLIQVRTILKAKDGFILVGLNGIFSLKNSVIKPLTYFENINQLVPVNSVNYYHYNFIPRCCELIQDNMYLIGGQFGGLVLVDLNKIEIRCYDDDDNLETIELFSRTK